MGAILDLESSKRRHDDHRYVRSSMVQLSQDIESIRTRKMDVEQHSIRFVEVDRFADPFTTGYADHPKAIVSQPCFAVCEPGRVVVDHEDHSRQSAFLPLRHAARCWLIRTRSRFFVAHLSSVSTCAVARIGAWHQEQGRGQPRGPRGASEI